MLACAGGLLLLGPDGDPAATAPAGRSTAAGSEGGDRATDPVRAARSATRRHPEDPVAWAGLAAAELERARTTLDAGRLDAADKALSRSMSLKPEDNYPAVTGLGQLANARHEFKRAQKYGKRSTRMAPDRPDGYAVLADAEIQLGNYPAARRAVQRLLDLAPASAAYGRAAYDLETHGRNADAAVALRRAEQAAETGEESAYAAARAGDLAWAQGKLGSAADHFDRALRARPDHPHALAGRARVRAAQGQTASALRTYRKLTDRVPTPQFLLEHLEARLAAGERKGTLTRGLRSALDAQVRLARSQGGPVDPHLARYEADHGDPGTAVALLRPQARTSDSVIVADALGWALHRSGKDAEALDWVRKAARTGWHNPLFLCHRGAVEKALGMPEGSRHLDAGRDLNPAEWPCRSRPAPHGTGADTEAQHGPARGEAHAGPPPARTFREGTAR